MSIEKIDVNKYEKNVLEKPRKVRNVLYLNDTQKKGE
jgi:hypothetical protein